jgi:hypothetical protein
MKANELRIGNWVNSKPYGDYKIVALTIFKDNTNFFQSEEYYPKSSRIEDLKPIPLTEEWLTRLGFERTLNHQNHDWTLNNVDLCFSIDESGYYLNTVNDTCNTMTKVHQLQRSCYKI